MSWWTASASEIMLGFSPRTKLFSHQILVSFLQHFTSDSLDLLAQISQSNDVFPHPLTPRESWLGRTSGGHSVQSLTQSRTITDGRWGQPWLNLQNLPRTAPVLCHPPLGSVFLTSKLTLPSHNQWPLPLLMSTGIVTALRVNVLLP